MNRFFQILQLIGFFVFASFSQPVSPENKIADYVTDKTGTLSSSQIQLLEKKLSAFDKETSTQVVVWMVSSLEGESLEEKSFEIAEQNGIGQKGKNNGALLFIAKEDRKLRIEVGYGLEGALPDALCGQIIRKEITPLFKQGKFYEGINSGVDAIIKATRGEYTRDTDDEKDSGIGILICGIPLFVVVFGFIILIGFISMIRRLAGFGGKRNSWWYSGGSSGSSSSWSGGSSFSSGGFSGGGGSFGGGGASGSW